MAGGHSFPSCQTFNLAGISSGNGTGDSDFTFTTSFSSAVYTAIAGSGYAGVFASVAPTANREAGGFTIQAYNHAGCITDIEGYVVGYGDQ